jgi:hypothetical protein
MSVFLLFSCSSTTQHIRYQNGTTVTYKLPSGWKVKQVTPPSDHFNIIEPDEFNDSHPGITIDYHANTSSPFAHTQEGYAKQYLHEIHNVKDDKVKMEPLKTVSSSTYGDITIYRFYSNYFGDHLVAMVLNDTGYCVVELWRTISDQQYLYQLEFEYVVSTIIMKHK